MTPAEIEGAVLGGLSLVEALLDLLHRIRAHHVDAKAAQAVEPQNPVTPQ